MRRRIWVAGLVVVGAIGWYLFRPELLFVKTRLNESLPTAAVAQMAPTAGVEKAGAGVLLAGMFHSVAHETRGSATVEPPLAVPTRATNCACWPTSSGWRRAS